MSNPFKGLGASGLELKSITNSKALRLSLVGVAIIPLLYGALYLWAFLDPYSQFNKMPVAVVNLDEGALIGGEYRNLGDELVASLADNDDGLGWVFVTNEEASAGLKANRYYLVATIPSSFSDNIASLDSKYPRQAVVQIQHNQSANLIASQVGGSVFSRVEARFSQKITEIYVTSVFGQIEEGAEAFSEAADGATKVHQGLIVGSAGSQAVTDGLGALSDGTNALLPGVAALQNGAQQLALAAGYVDQIASGMYDAFLLIPLPTQEQIDSIKQIDAALAQIAPYAPQMLDVIDALSPALDTLLLYPDQADTALDNIEALIDPADPNYDAIMGYLGEARGYNAQTRAGLLTAKDNLSLVQGTARSVVDAIVALDQMGLSQIADGFGMLGQLKDTLGILKSITTPLKDGAVAFAASMPTLISGLQSFSEGITALHEGSQQVSTGIAEIETGSDELSTQMHEGAEAMEMGPREAQAKVTQITSPVVFESSYYTKVANYGTGFAPYFIALGLWVGTLITTFVIRPLNRRMLTQGASPVAAVLSGYFPLALVGICQAVLLLACLQFALKLQVDHVFGYYAFGILTALVFVAIVQFVVFVFGLPGSFACVVLLMLQLTSAAGTFPLETAPRFFQIINPFLPMTYAVSGLRVLTSGVNMDIVWQSTGILALFGLVFLTASCLFAQFKRTVRMTDLYPAFQINK